MTTKKRGQHYVQAFYLRAWERDGTLYCSRLDRPVFRTNAKDAANQRDFYRLRDLTDADLQLISHFIEQSPGHLRLRHRKLTQQFALLPRLHAAALHSGDCETIAALNVAVQNHEEDLHQTIEQLGEPFLRAVREGHGDFFKDDGRAAQFLHYLAYQCMRTKKVRDRVHAGVEASNLPGNFNKIWNVVAHILATNVSWSLFADRRSLTLLIMNNATSLPLLTCDQPLINTHGRADGTPPEELEWYYPVSPKRAILLTAPGDPDRTAVAALSEDEVANYNCLVLSAAHEQLFSSDGTYLETILSRDHRA